MDVLAGAKRAFVSVNVAGKVNDTWLDPEQQVLGGVQDALSLSLRRAQAPAGPRSLVQHIHQGSQYAAGYSFAWSRIALGTCLSLQRSIPPFWGGEAVLAKSVL